jgi:hypothetical protein
MKLELNNKFIDIITIIINPFQCLNQLTALFMFGESLKTGVLSPQSTKYESFEDILSSNNFINNIKTQSF